MKPEYIFLILFILIILIFHVATAKGDRKRVTIVNSNSENVFVDVELADSTTMKFKGMMGRKELGENEGMLFIFESANYHSFWMFNTTIPLDAIFFDESKNVVDVKNMEPCGLNLSKCKAHIPSKPAKYVLEVNQGFAERNSIIPGKSRVIIG
jgi:uncharacterized membrane protein (UPF0127 family)